MIFTLVSWDDEPWEWTFFQRRDFFVTFMSNSDGRWFADVLVSY